MMIGEQAHLGVAELIGLANGAPLAQRPARTWTAARTARPRRAAGV